MVTAITLGAPVSAMVPRLFLTTIMGLGLRLVRGFTVKAIVRLPFVPTRLAAFFKTRPVFGDDAEIMVCELKIIFRQHAIALELRLAREVLVLLKKLRRIAPCAVINPAAIILTTAIAL